MRLTWIRLAVWAGIAAAAGVVLMASGVIPIKASAGHWPVTEWLLRFAMKRSISTHSLGIEVPKDLDRPGLILKGAGHYEIGCRSCHGSPGRPLPPLVRGMLPRPPDLLERIQEADPRHLFYVVKHGIKFTGMPGWPAPQRDDEVWAMVAFLRHYPQLDAAGYERLVRPEAAANAVPAVGSEAGASPPSSALQSCVGCHGADGLGRGSEALPRLAGQGAEYLRQALEAYADGRRHSGTMAPVASGLSPAARDEVVRHYARLPGGVAPAASAGDAAAIARGESIALRGIPGERVPACVECHGPHGARRKPDYPLLAGQSADYLRLQLTLFRENRRGGAAHAHVMQPIAARLTPRQIEDVARYFEAAKAEPRSAASR